MLELETAELEAYQSPDRIIQYKLEIRGLFGAGQWLDISDRLVGKIGLRKETEHKGSLSTNTFNFVLRNDDGHFSPNNGNSPYVNQLTEKKEVKIGVKVYNKEQGIWYDTRRFTGYTEKFKPNAKKQTCTVTGKDFMSNFIGDENKLTKNEVLVDKTVKQAIKEVFYRVYNAKEQFEKDKIDSMLDLDTVNKTIGFLNLNDVEPAKVLEKINDVCAGRMYFDEYGKFIFRSGLGARSTTSMDTITINRLSDVTVETGKIDCNECTVKSENKQPQERQMIFHWTDCDKKTNEGNASTAVTGVYISKDGFPIKEDDEGNPIDKRWYAEFTEDICIDVDSAEFIKIRDESGDKLPNVYVDPLTYDVQSDKARIDIVNDNGTGRFIGTFEIYGKPVISKNPIDVTYALGEDKIDFRKTKEISSDLITSDSWANELAQFHVFMGSKMLPVIQIDFKADPRYQIGDIVTIIESNTGLSHKFEIISFDEVLGNDYQLRTTLIMLVEEDFISNPTFGTMNVRASMNNAPTINDLYNLSIKTREYAEKVAVGREERLQPENSRLFHFDGDISSTDGEKTFNVIEPIN